MTTPLPPEDAARIRALIARFPKGGIRVTELDVQFLRGLVLIDDHYWSREQIENLWSHMGSDEPAAEAIPRLLEQQVLRTAGGIYMLTMLAHDYVEHLSP
ncbi:MAG: hypothetical protein ACO3JL_06810 [Myxococcota bacterium]